MGRNSAKKTPTVSSGAGWQSLFDGKTLSGWKTFAKGQRVEVVNGEIHILSKKTNLWLLSEKSFENFEFEVEVKMPVGIYNSGIGFRCTNSKKLKGYQCEIDKKKSGSIYGIGKGWVSPAKKSAWPDFYKNAADCFVEGQWNKIRLRCLNDHIQVWINGVKTSDVKDKRFTEGHFALQHHGKGDVHSFRNIKVKELK